MSIAPLWYVAESFGTSAVHAPVDRWRLSVDHVAMTLVASDLTVVSELAFEHRRRRTEQPTLRFWADQYHASATIDDDAFITYTLMNRVAAGLTATVGEHPGLSSVEANVGIRRARGAIDVPIELPPRLAELDATELPIQRRWLPNEIRRREAAVKAERVRRGLRCGGAPVRVARLDSAS